VVKAGEFFHISFDRVLAFWYDSVEMEEGKLLHVTSRGSLELRERDRGVSAFMVRREGRRGIV
jgi:hypothetical protein